MTAREHLEQARKIKALIDRDLDEARRLTEQAGSVQAVDFGDKVSGGDGSAPYISLVEEIVTLENRAQDRKKELEAAKREVRKAIEPLPDSVAKRALVDYYVECFSLIEIGRRCQVAVRTVKRRLERGIEEYDQIFKF